MTLSQFLKTRASARRNKGISARRRRPVLEHRRVGSYQRNAAKLDGLTDEQLRHPLTPSGMCLLALAKHVVGVPYHWFYEVFGRPCEPWPGARTDDVELDPGDTTSSVLAYYARSRAASDQAITELDLDTTGTTWLGDTVSFRWAILHVIEEAARHAGHADLMRERIDNTTGYLPDNLPY